MQSQFAFEASSRQAVIRAAEASDIEGMARVSVDTWKLTYAGILPTGYLARMRTAAHESQRRRLMQGSHTVHFVAEEPVTGEVVGFVSAGPARGGGPGVTAEIYELYVQNGFQGQGLGRRLLEAGQAWLMAQGHDAVIVWVLADNANRRFYERLGGEAAGLRTIRVGGALVDEAAYVWSDLMGGAQL